MLRRITGRAEPIQEENTDRKILLVTQTRATLEALSGISFILATTAFSAANKVLNDNPQIIIWDLSGPPLETEIPIYIWHRDIGTAGELKSLLKQLLPDSSSQHQLKINKKVHARLVILSPFENRALKPFKNKYLVDASGEFSRTLEINEDGLWKADWRLGIDARPLKINGVDIYTQTELLGSLDELDQVRFIEFIENLLTKKKPVYVIDSGRWREELLRLGAVIMEGGS